MTVKTALISPAIAAQQMAPMAQDENRLFEDKFGQMAYQAFSSKFPDLVPDIVTFKILDTDMDDGSSCGAFILEQEGEYLYIPAVLSENELKPFDMVYVKSRDIFVPLTTKWLEEIQKNTISSLGEGAQLPETVARDVDIRNVVTPPTAAGRHSYASVSSQAKMAALASEPLGRRLTKIAIGNFPDPNGGGGGAGAQSQFDPQAWAGFVQQFQTTQGTSPGQALDQGFMDIDALSKLYKAHTKAWSTPELPAQQQAQAEAAPQGMPPGDPGMQTMASVKTANAAGVKTIGKRIDEALSNAVRSAGVGAVTGGAMGASDGDWSDVPSAMVRGGVGGALVGPIGNLMGEEVHARFPDKVPLDAARTYGRLGGGVFGGVVGAHSDPVQVQIVPQYGENPGIMSRATALMVPPGISQMMRMGSDYQSGLKDMVKHALAPSAYKPFLPDFLKKAPNNVKQAYIEVLDKNPSLLKRATDIYGSDTLVDCLSPTKTAGSVEIKKPFRMVDLNTSPTEYKDYFGQGAPFAYQNVLKRGYYYEDRRPGLKLAVQVQEFHDFQNALDTGIYRLYSSDTTPTGALVVVEPLDLFGEDRATFPHDASRVKPIRNRIPKTDYNQEPHALTRSEFENKTGPTASQLSHTFKRLAILEDRSYITTDNLFGEQVSEGYLKGTSLFTALNNDGGRPRAGTGVFVGRVRGSYIATMPLEIKDVNEGSDGIIRGKMVDWSGFAKKPFLIDKRSTRGRAMRPKDGPVIIPASWVWVPLTSKKEAGDFITDPSALSEVVKEKFSKDADIKIAAVRADGSGLFVIDDAPTSHQKSAALYTLAQKHHVHASAAEAMLKIAQAEGVCRAYLVTPEVYRHTQARIKIAQGMMPPQVPQGAPPAMMPPSMPGAMPQPLPGDAAQMPPAEPPPPPAPSPVDQAFGESLDGLQQQMSELQAQMSVLQSVQQRAQQIEMEQSGMAPPEAGMQGSDPAMAGQGAPPGAGMDPMAMGGEQMPPEEQQLPIMRTEEPSVEEITQQISPDFLESASQLHETGAFDAASIASLAQNSGLKPLTSQYAANLENSVDDLGRTLLTLYMQESKLKTQLGDETYLDLETQLRDTFHGLGRLVLSMTHNSAMLDPDATP
jgi:hypothetical protein